MTYVAFGNYGLAGTMLASAGCIFSAIRAVRSNQPDSLRTARRLTHGITLLLTVSSAILLKAILDNDFHLAYVAGHSERALPLAYKVAAFWAGHEGSLLLWAWLTGVVGSIMIFLRRKDPQKPQAAAMGLMAGVAWFFSLILLFAANPFEPAKAILPDGLGLNPLLHNPAMILHPLLLFIGYAGLAAPFALYIGNLIAGRSGNAWIGPVRNWNLVSWLFLTAGIVLGAWWAYVELGWGGYWAWDPVENASLFPWLTSTALIHSLISQQRRGTLKIWNAFFVPLTFWLCIFGTFLTRTGVVASVHAFPDTGVGSLFMIMMIAIAQVSVGVIIWRRNHLKSDRPIKGLVSEDGAFTVGSGLLVMILLTTLLGTIYTLIINPFTATPEMLGPEFYNSVMAPMTMVLVGIMGFGPVLRFAGTPGKMRRRLFLPLITMHAGFILAAWFIPPESWLVGSGLNRQLNLAKLWTVLSAGLGTLVVVCIVQNLILAAIARWRVPTTFQSLRVDLRRYGGYVAHLGMVMIVAGVAGSSLHETQADLTLAPHQSHTLGQYTLRYDSFDESSHDTYESQAATIVLTKADGTESIIQPHKRRYFKPDTQNTTSEVAIHSNFSEDIYVILSDWWPVDDAESGTTATNIKIKVLIKPLVIWIWIGGIAMIAGSLICLVFSGPKRSSVLDVNERPGTETGGLEV